MSAPRTAVVVGNPRPRSRTPEAALRVADRLGGVDLVVDLAEHSGSLLDPEAGQVDELVSDVRSCGLVVVASLTFKATYTGLLKAFLDRFPHRGLAGVVAVPVMLGSSPVHALAPEHSLRPLLVELGASVPTAGLFVVDRDHADPAAYDAWLETARPLLPTALPDRPDQVVSA